MFGPDAVAAGIGKLDVSRILPRRHGGVGRGVAGGSFSECDGNASAGARGANAVDVKLARVGDRFRHGGRPKVSSGIIEMPMLNAHRSADDWVRARSGGEDKIVSIAAGVSGREVERLR